MCLICVEFDKLTLVEARRNFCEMRASIGEEHAQEVEKKINDRAIEELNDLLKDFDPFVMGPPEFSDAEPFVDENQFDEAFGGCFMTGWDEIEFPDDDEPFELELED